MKYLSSLNNSIIDILKNNKKSFLIGEDIKDPYGGAFKVTKNISKNFSKKVFSTPISESAITGIAGGLALKGHNVILEIMFGDFLPLIIDQIHNGISKSLELKKDGSFGSLTIRTPMGGYRGYGCTHSQSTETLLMNTPNISIFSPNIFIDPGELLTKAITKEKLSLFVEHKVSYSKECNIKFYKDTELFIKRYDDYTKVKIFNDEPDYSILTYGHASEIGLNAIYEYFIENEVNGELIVFNKINDNKSEAFENINSNNILTLEEGISKNGWGKMITSKVYEKKLKKLEKPVINIGAKNKIIPSSKEKEEKVLPSVLGVQKEIFNLLNN